MHPIIAVFIIGFVLGWASGRGALRNGLQRANEKLQGKR